MNIETRKYGFCGRLAYVQVPGALVKYVYNRTDRSVRQIAAFFTGKPQIPGLGRAFLFRNYRPDLAKWQTADPLGYLDGWNLLAYCGNRVTGSVDLWGCSTYETTESDSGWYSIDEEISDIDNVIKLTAPDLVRLTQAGILRVFDSASSSDSVIEYSRASDAVYYETAAWGWDKLVLRKVNTTVMRYTCSLTVEYIIVMDKIRAVWYNMRHEA